ncbi:MAG: heme-binding domain-containing protein [Flavobacteriaceae bacterium]|nr:heme-binding domain-containing protein [Flavobacteriaceae bacterium]
MFSFKKIGFIVLVVFTGIQLIPATRNQSDEVFENDLTKNFDVPDDIQNILKKSCYDCHSNNTDYPWYNKVQPISWILENHIKEGKAALNFNDFGTYSNRKQKSKLRSIRNQIHDGEMPLYSYTLMHSNAKLSEKEKDEVFHWIDKLYNSLK